MDVHLLQALLLEERFESCAAEADRFQNRADLLQATSDAHQREATVVRGEGEAGERCGGGRQKGRRPQEATQVKGAGAAGEWALRPWSGQPGKGMERWPMGSRAAGEGHGEVAEGGDGETGPSTGCYW